ncbi:MAG: penicillinase repressor [Planctomycetaceae bacterium]|nr:penicillinase repressor [Planctomycetaceae bacterium]
MARQASRHPTELELEILKILWRDGPLTGRGVRDRLAQTRELAYTSVMTIMGIMDDKGYVKRKKSGKTFIYSPRVTEAATKKRMLRDVVDRVYEGSTMSVVVNLLESSDIEPDELKQLRALIKRKSEE